MTSNGNGCHCVTALFLIHLIEIFCYKRILHLNQYYFLLSATILNYK